jgi:hypothetical protein
VYNIYIALKIIIITIQRKDKKINNNEKKKKKKNPSSLESYILDPCLGTIFWYNNKNILCK